MLELEYFDIILTGRPSKKDSKYLSNNVEVLKEQIREKNRGARYNFNRNRTSSRAK